MRVLAIVHQEDAGPGVFGEELPAQGVELECWRVPEEPEPPRDAGSYGAVMTFGGAMHIDQADRHEWLVREQDLLRELIDRGTPLLGACLGAQLLCAAGGGEVTRMREPEIGWVDVDVDDPGDPLMGPLAPRFSAFEWHSYACEPPPGSVVLARSEQCAQAFRIGEAAWGIQFHAEVSTADAAKWIAEWRTDEDAVRIGLDADALRAETDDAIAAWNDLGRAMAGRFIEAAAANRSSLA